MLELFEEAQAGNRRALARLISQVERGMDSLEGEDSAESIIGAVYPHTGRAHVIGVTGAPGSGKSSLVNELAKAFRRQTRTVGVIAVDPSSPFTGGALLGDRIRMRDLSGDKGVFIRSMASRGRLGGLARATAGVVKILDAVGFEIILIETVGAGQAEVDIAGAAHTTLVVEAPGMGDDIQTIKAGILEIADIIVLNKSDRPGRESTVKALRAMLRLGHSTRARADHPESYWHPALQETVAINGEGIPDLVQTIQRHWEHLHATGEWLEREKDRSRQEIEQLLSNHLLRRLARAVPQAEREGLVAAVAQRQLDPYTAVAQLSAQLAVWS